MKKAELNQCLSCKVGAILNESGLILRSISAARFDCGEVAVHHQYGAAKGSSKPLNALGGRSARLSKIRLGALVGLFIFAGLLASEASLRLSGLTSFPIFMRAPGVAYYPAPNQSGAFLNKNHWYVNAQGFENDRPFAVLHPGAMLIGDSIIDGGNPTDYQDKVGPIAAKTSGVQIWVGAAGGWRLLNELAFLETHRSQLKSVDQLILLLKDGDFDAPASATDELSFPTHRPFLLTSYVIHRYLQPHSVNLPPVTQEEEQAFQRQWSTELDELLDDYHRPITLILYPDEYDFQDAAAWQSDTAAIRGYAARHTSRIKIVDLRGDLQWSAGMYKDGIHPNLAGDRVLGALVAAICSSASD